ncbi:MAG: bifunctional 5,10-methylene-tetrahydrofolate dehydrogenase/5,10-methylene-tetrahydrofolate cyclohydrolase, partial [Saprospiraceae bacterium]|nr:bifunctional 5,10-methylene-tetrahydrofolate dehydrogenase/5,10-methylene-tetrahydrofolate cyclohydrolase [Saprospiraceae bacterium]
MIILDGKKLAHEIKKEIADEVMEIKAAGGNVPHLAAVLVGDDPASHAYVRNKVNSCNECGFESTLIKKDDSITEEELLEIVNDLNTNEDIDGFIVQLPLPKHIDESKVTLAIDHRKDVDGFHPINFGRMAQGMSSYLPATPFGILQMIERNKIETEGKHCVILGRS